MNSAQPNLDINLKYFDAANEAAELAWQRPRLEKICAILRTLPNKTVGADLGCVNGLATVMYAATGIQTLHGYDVSEPALQRLRQKGFEGFYWNFDGGPCPKPDATYDVVIAGEIIEHLIDTDSCAREIYRILKPGGTVILSTPNLVSWFNRIRLLRGKPPMCGPGTSATLRRDVMVDNKHIRVNVLSEWTYFMESHGFQIVDIQGTSHLQILRGSWRNTLVRMIDRVASRFPTIAVGLIMVARKPA